MTRRCLESGVGESAECVAKREQQEQSGGTQLGARRHCDTPAAPPGVTVSGDRGKAPERTPSSRRRGPAPPQHGGLCGRRARALSPADTHRAPPHRLPHAAAEPRPAGGIPRQCHAAGIGLHNLISGGGLAPIPISRSTRAGCGAALCRGLSRPRAVRPGLSQEHTEPVRVRD